MSAHILLDYAQTRWLGLFKQTADKISVYDGEQWWQMLQNTCSQFNCS